jgi:hypothetical protein
MHGFKPFPVSIADPSDTPPAAGQVKLLAIRPTGLHKLSKPMNDWFGSEEAMTKHWLSKDGRFDVDAIQLLHADGMVSTVYREGAPQ